MSLLPQTKVPVSGAWEYDVAFADSGFQSDVKTAIEQPMKALNTELQARSIAQSLQIIPLCPRRLYHKKTMSKL